MSLSSSGSDDSAASENSEWSRENLHIGTDDENLHNDTDEEDTFVFNSVVNPYENEPLAVQHPGQEVLNDEQDEDGISPQTLESRFDGHEPVDQWCACRICSTQLLAGALEFRCCREVGPALYQLTFDGSIEKINCVTEHEDYLAITHPTVLKQVGSLLRDKNGRSYKRRTGQNLNEHLRAVAYRWIVRWMCGTIGWENSRPLPACIYTNIRKRFPVGQHIQHQGYLSSQKRA